MKIFLLMALLLMTVEGPALANPLLPQPEQDFLLNFGPSDFNVTDEWSSYVQEFYRLRNRRAVWVDRGRLTDRFYSLHRILQDAPRHGLRFEIYWDSVLDNAVKRPDRLGDPLKVELQATRALIRYSAHLSVGRVDPQSVSRDIKYRRKNFSNVKYLAQAVDYYSYQFSEMIDNLAPQQQAYKNMQAALAKLRAIRDRGGWDPIYSPGVPLQLGSQHPVITKMKARLIDHGYAIYNNTPDFDSQFDAAIRSIQQDSNLQPTGVLAPNEVTWDFFATNSAKRIRQIEMNMEKMRWIPRQLEDRHIFINLAFQHFTLMDKAVSYQPLFDFRTINGRPDRKTPSMQDKVVSLIFNPNWTVPPTIFIEDKVEIIKKFKSPQEIYDYFNQNHYVVWNKNFTQQIDPTTIDWNNITRDNMDIYIQQKPNYFNALGVVKFNLTNPYVIYLHDTGQRELFAESNRLLSSGCIRLEKPIDVAEYLMQGTSWNRQKIEEFVAKPGEVKDKETEVPTRSPIPVYLLYLTVDQGPSGEIRFARDHYSQDKDVYDTLVARGYIQEEKGPQQEP